MPVVELAKKVKTLEIGQEFEMVSDDVGSKEDVPAWCKRTGNQLLDVKEENGTFTYHIKRLK